MPGLANPVFFAVCIQHIVVLVRNLSHDAYRRTAYIRIALDMPAEAGGIRGGIAAGKLADQLRKRQTDTLPLSPALFPVTYRTSVLAGRPSPKSADTLFP